MKFKPFNPLQKTDKSRRNLPHWRQDGGCYFISFRLGDSLPQSLLDQWKREREAWLSRHPVPWSPKIESEHDELFNERREQQLDAGHGGCQLRQSEVRSLAAASVTRFDGERHTLDAYVIMPNHVHLLWQLHSGIDLGKELKGLNGASAGACNAMLGQAGTFWMDESYDRIVRNFEELNAFRDYIRNNPAKAELKPHEHTLEIRNALEP